MPIRVAARDFIPSKSQRRIMRKCRGIEVALRPLRFREEYSKSTDPLHEPFRKESDRDEFIYSFFMQTCPSMQSEYYLDGRLMAVGFLDRSSHGLSSVYFIYDTEYESYSPGNFSVIREIELTAAMGLDYYYLGYYITQNRSMAYSPASIPTNGNGLVLRDMEQGITRPGADTKGRRPRLITAAFLSI